MKSIFSFLRLFRGKVFGFDAVQARFDILQNKLDALEASFNSLNESVDEIGNRLNKNKSAEAENRLPRELPYRVPIAHLQCEFQRSTVRCENKSSSLIVHDGPTISRIGFLLHSLELVNHYGCVWDVLPEGSFDVILHGDAVTADATALSRWNCTVFSSSEIIQSNAKYRFLVSNHPVSIGEQPLIKRLANINVRFMYAAGKSGWNLSEWNNLYDLILCFGPYHAAAFTNSTDAVVVQMGYPRFDRYFTTKPNMKDLQARYDCDPMKKTIVWLPTWKTLSSIGYFDEEISSLTDNYNVVVKLHPLMPESEPERVKALTRNNFTHLITDASDNLPLYQLADFMLFDYGGPPLAGIYADKKLILLNVPGADSDELTGDDSPDISIRKYLINVNAEERSIAQLLNDSSLWKAQRAASRMLRKYYFAPYFGFSSNTAANALMNLDHIVSNQV